MSTHGRPTRIIQRHTHVQRRDESSDRRNKVFTAIMRMDVTNYTRAFSAMADDDMYVCSINVHTRRPDGVRTQVDYLQA
eukprot:831618-Prorocentrum_minimum.AAC.6